MTWIQLLLGLVKLPSLNILLCKGGKGKKSQFCYPTVTRWHPIKEYRTWRKAEGLTLLALPSDLSQSLEERGLYPLKGRDWVNREGGAQGSGRFW